MGNHEFSSNNFLFSSEQLGCYYDVYLQAPKHDKVFKKRLDENIRKITMHPIFRRKGGGLNPPNSTLVNVEGKTIPRDVIVDCQMVAKIMVVSRMIDHGLDEQELEEVFTYYCLPVVVNGAKGHGVDHETSINILSMSIDNLINYYRVSD